MKREGRQWMRFLFFVAGAIGINLLLSYYFLNHTQYKRNLRFRQEAVFAKSQDTINYLFMGASRLNRAVDEKRFPKAWKSYGGTETTPYIYGHLQHLLLSGKKIGCVILPAELNHASFHPSQIELNAIYWNQYLNWWELAYHAEEPFGILTTGIKIKLFPYYQYPRQLLTARDNRMNRDMPTRKRMQKPFSSFEPEEQQRQVSELVSSHTAGPYVASEGKYYLKKIIALCERNHLPMLFVKFPVTGMYRDSLRTAVPNAMEQEEELDHIIQTAKGAILLDFLNIYTDSLHLFYDPQHLNKQGQLRFSEMLYDTIQPLALIHPSSEAVEE